MPVVELTDAERNRLPSFAQPRRTPPTPTGLNSLALPPGLPSVVSPIPQQRRPSPARRNPTPTPQTRTRQRLPQTITRAPLRSPSFDPSSITTRDVPRTPPAVDFFSQDQSRIVLERSIDVAAGPISPTDGQTSGNGNSNLPNLGGTASDLDPGDSADYLGEVLARQNEASQTEDTESAETPTSARERLLAGIEPQEEISRTPVDVQEVPSAPAQGNASRLLNGFEYSPENTDEETVATNLKEWKERIAESKANVIESEAEVTIDSQFRVCKPQAPQDGLIGVVVNPDGSQESAEVLKSTGYTLLNRQALTAIEYQEFEPSEVSTQYTVTVDVIYEPEGCVDELPETETDEAETE